MCLSVPFSSGQWLLQDYSGYIEAPLKTFSPLFVGAMVATKQRQRQRLKQMQLSVPFSSGQWLLPRRRSLDQT